MAPLPEGRSITVILSLSFWMYWYCRIWSVSEAESRALACACPSARVTVASAWPFAWATAWSAWIFFWARTCYSVWTCCWATCLSSIAFWNASEKAMLAM
jgi:hypothetical protein